MDDKKDVHRATLGHLGFAGLVFVAAAYPFVLPWVHVVFFSVFMPLRYDPCGLCGFASSRGTTHPLPYLVFISSVFRVHRR